MESLAADDARRSLDLVAAARLDVAERLRTPWWYYPALGLMSSQVVLVYGLVGVPAPSLRSLLMGASLFVQVLGGFWLQRTFADRTGVLARRPEGRRSRAAFAAFVLGMLGPLLYVFGAVFLTGILGDGVSTQGVIALAAVQLVAALVLGPVYEAACRADIRDRGDG